MPDSVEEFDSLDSLALKIKKRLNTFWKKKRVAALYAFNASGKTRLSNILSGFDDEGEAETGAVTTLCYNAILEDIFTWDNEGFFLKFQEQNWIIQLVKDQGLEKRITENFHDVIASHIEPYFDFEKSAVSFLLASGDDDYQSNIKISRSEESMLIWAIFFTVLETAIEELDTDVENRSTKVFNDLQYVIIDDPVSSIDDTGIIAMALKLQDKIKYSKKHKLKYVITTHHALFYNVLWNSFKHKAAKEIWFSLLSKDSNIFLLKKQGDSPFAYHLFLKTQIQEAVANNSIEKYHFNLFRNLLEKTANYFGYNYFGDCIPSGERKDEFIRLLHLYSHGKLSELESRNMSREDRLLFEEVFEVFVAKFS